MIQGFIVGRSGSNMPEYNTIIAVFHRVIVPFMLVSLSLPLIYQIVPRNRLYGFRTPYTLSSEDVWYRANKICGIALLAAGMFWLCLALVLPNIISPTQRAHHLVQGFGIGSLIVALIVTTWLIYRRKDAL
jgi:hypothetical protein